MPDELGGSMGQIRRSAEFYVRIRMMFCKEERVLDVDVR